MSERIVVDPITRIEGHLRIEAQMEGKRIRSAYSSGMMVRGIETIHYAKTSLYFTLRLHHALVISDIQQ